MRRELSNQCRRLDGRRVDGHLVGAGSQQPPGVYERAHTAADRERNEEPLRHAVDSVHQRPAAFAGGGNVEHHKLVRAFAVVGFRELARVTRVAQVHELDPFDHAAVLAVQTRNDSFREHRNL